MRHVGYGGAALAVTLAAALPAAAAPAPTAEQLAAAMHAVAPPSAGEGVWSLGFRFHDLRAVTVEPPGGPKKTFWVLRYEVVNPGGAPRTFIPSFELDTGGQAVRDGVYPKHFAERNSVTVVKEPIPAVKPGAPAKGVEAVAVWECADPDAKAATVFVQGLTNDFTVIPGADLTRPTLRLEFRGDRGVLRFAKPAAWEARPSQLETLWNSDPKNPADAERQLVRLKQEMSSPTSDEAATKELVERLRRKIQAFEAAPNPNPQQKAADVNRLKELLAEYEDDLRVRMQAQRKHLEQLLHEVHKAWKD